MGRMLDVGGVLGKVRDSFPGLWRARLGKKNAPPEIPTEVLLISGFNDNLRRVKSLEKNTSDKARIELRSVLKCLLTDHATAHLESITDPRYQSAIVKICHRISLLKAIYPNVKMTVGEDSSLSTHEEAIDHYHMLLIGAEKQLSDELAKPQATSRYALKTRLKYLQDNTGIFADLDRKRSTPFHVHMVPLLMLRLEALVERLNR